MPKVNLPTGAKAGFHLHWYDAWDNSFNIHIYGSGRSGWFMARSTVNGVTQELGVTPLGRGQWRELLGLVKQADFWNLPENLPKDPSTITDDGEFLTFEGRDEIRYHTIHREEFSRELWRIEQFLRRLTGWFPEPAPREEPTETPTDPV